MRRKAQVAAMVTMAMIPLSACGAGSSGGPASTELTSGPIDIWYSTNKQEITWAGKVVKAWNDQHPDQEVKAQAIPAGKSSEDVIGAVSSEVQDGGAVFAEQGVGGVHGRGAAECGGFRFVDARVPSGDPAVGGEVVECGPELFAERAAVCCWLES